MVRSPDQHAIKNFDLTHPDLLDWAEWSDIKIMQKIIWFFLFNQALKHSCHTVL